MPLLPRQWKLQSQAGNRLGGPAEGDGLLAMILCQPLFVSKDVIDIVPCDHVSTIFQFCKKIADAACVRMEWFIFICMYMDILA